MDSEQLCTLCDKSLVDTTDVVVQVQEKGLRTFITKSIERQDGKHEKWIGKSLIEFHQICRINYYTLSRKRCRSTSDETDESQDRCSSNPTNFDFHNLCFICGEELNRKHKKVCSVQNDEMKSRMMKLAYEKNDEKAQEFIRRIKHVTSLMELRAAYHRKCYHIYTSIQSKRTSTPNIKNENEALFQEVSNFIENSGQFQFSLSELREVQGSEYLTDYLLFKKLEAKYEKDIYVLRHAGREPQIFYKSFNSSNICSDWFHDNDSLDELKKKTILSVAARILRSEIEKSHYNNESYPSPHDFLNDVTSDVPPFLRLFLDDLLQSKPNRNIEEKYIKRDFISHAIISIIRPRTFTSTLQLATSTYVYRKTGSRLVIDLLAKLGAAASYHNTQLYESSIIMDPPNTTFADDTFIQHVFDNTDHNVATLTGQETFHCLGGIAAYTPGSSVLSAGSTKKLKVKVESSVLATQNQIPIIPYGNFNLKAMDTIEYVATDKLRLDKPPILPPSYAAYLWAKCAHVPTFPSWRGFMETVTYDETYEVSHIQCLPFINEPPSDLTTLNTSLHYAVAQCQELGQKTCFVTYDQPLYWKARSIVERSIFSDGKLKNVVVRLGTFHTIMSYLGCIGYIMQGSGLEDLWSTIYAAGSIKHLMTGHAYSRAVRAHILTYTALGIKICQSLDLSEEQNQELASLFRNWSSDPPHLGDFKQISAVRKMAAAFEEKLAEFEENEPTAKLWVQYFRSVTVLLQVIESERLGNWDLHLQSIRQMLPFFHAAGHLLYAKSAQIYLQDMEKLDYTIDDEDFDKFTKHGFFTIRRSDKAWAGIFSDMTIEQTLNRFFGTDLKHGRGVTPSVVARYLLAMPTAFAIMENLETYCDIESKSSEQHVDLSNSRLKEDDKHLKLLLDWLEDEKHVPFRPRPSLMSLSTGVIGGADIDCHMACEKGMKGMNLMVGKNIANLSLSKVYRVKTLADAKTTMHVKNQTSSVVDTHLIFQKISFAVNKNPDALRSALAYELSPYPLSLFDEKGLMRKTQKADLYKEFTPYPIQDEIILAGSLRVVDGGWLLRRVTWPHTQTYRQLFEIYLQYIRKNFGSNATVVFDGYNNELIGVKSYERYRRQEKSISTDVNINEDQLVTLNKNNFMLNTANKFKFVQLLSRFLMNNGIDTVVAEEDADVLIVRTAIKLKTNNPSADVTVVGNDVDLLVLLLALTPPRDEIFFQKIVKNPHVIYSTTTCHKKMQSSILFAHAFTGCDTTSTLFGKGKLGIIKILEGDDNLQSLASVFYHPDKTVDEIYAAAETFIFRLYGAAEVNDITIEQLRYRNFTLSVDKAKKEQPLALLPPTRSALCEHAKRVYYQIQHWLGNHLNPERWGWERHGTMMIPIMSTENFAPKELLDKISCSCRTSCTSGRCNCKRAGIHCSHLCKNCRPTCKNSETISNEDNADPASEEDADSLEVPVPSADFFYNFHDADEPMDT